eukprot:gene22717-34789_t
MRRAAQALLWRRRFARGVVIESSAGGRPEQEESAEEQKDARNFVERSEFDVITKPELDLQYLRPALWNEHVGEPSTDKEGITIVEINCAPEDLGIGTQMTSIAASHGLSLLLASIPPGEQESFQRFSAKLLFTQWVKYYDEVSSDAGYSELTMRHEYPCTPYSDDGAHGHYAWSTVWYKKEHKVMNYWRCFWRDDRSGFVIA